MMDDAIKIRHFQYEQEAVERLLEFLQQENIVLKARLAEALRESNFSADQIVAVEQFQERLLQKDAVIGIMRQEAAELKKMVVKYIHEDGTTKMILQKQKRLRKDLRLLGLSFSDLRMQFDGFIESLYWAVLLVFYVTGSCFAISTL